jgi:hypothetical protein
MQATLYQETLAHAAERATRCSALSVQLEPGLAPRPKPESGRYGGRGYGRPGQFMLPLVKGGCGCGPGRDGWVLVPRGGCGLVLASVGRRVVLLCHAGRDAPALTDRQAVFLRPGPDITAALTAGRGPPGPARLCPPGAAGVLNVGRELLAKRGGVLGIRPGGHARPGGPAPSSTRRRTPRQFRSAGWLPRRRLNDCSVALARLLGLGSARCVWPLAAWVGL